MVRLSSHTFIGSGWGGSGKVALWEATFVRIIPQSTGCHISSLRTTISSRCTALILRQSFVISIALQTCRVNFGEVFQGRLHQQKVTNRTPRTADKFGSEYFECTLYGTGIPTFFYPPYESDLPRYVHHVHHVGSTSGLCNWHFDRRMLYFKRYSQINIWIWYNEYVFLHVSL